MCLGVYVCRCILLSLSLSLSLSPSLSISLSTSLDLSVDPSFSASLQSADQCSVNSLQGNHQSRESIQELGRLAILTSSLRGGACETRDVSGDVAGLQKKRKGAGSEQLRPKPKKNKLTRKQRACDCCLVVNWHAHSITQSLSHLLTFSLSHARTFSLSFSFDLHACVQALQLLPTHEGLQAKVEALRKKVAKLDKSAAATSSTTAPPPPPPPEQQEQENNQAQQAHAGCKGEKGIASNQNPVSRPPRAREESSQPSQRAQKAAALGANTRNEATAAAGGAGAARLRTKATKKGSLHQLGTRNQSSKLRQGRFNPHQQHQSQHQQQQQQKLAVFDEFSTPVQKKQQPTHARVTQAAGGRGGATAKRKPLQPLGRRCKAKVCEN